MALLDEAALERRMRAIAREEACAVMGASPDDWISQLTSPLGRELHCRLVRDGALPGVRVHRRVLVRRRDLDQYIETHRAEPIEQDDEAVELGRVGARRVA